MNRQPTSLLSEEIDIRPFILALARHWQQIAGATLLSIFLAFAFTSLRPKVYVATATVANIRSRTEVALDSRIVAQLEDVNNSKTTRHEALVVLVSSNDVALAVLEEASQHLPLEQQNIAALLAMVEADRKGDLILITVRHNQADVAAYLANAWARQYEVLVNDVFSASQGSNDEILAGQVVQAGATYKLAQAELEAFLQDNPSLALKNDIATLQGVLDSYQQARIAVHSEPVKLQAATQQQILSTYYQSLQHIEKWLAEAEALRAQVEVDSGSTNANLGNVLALIALKGGFLGSPSSVELQIDLTSNRIEPVQHTDVEAIIQALSWRQAATVAQITILEAGWGDTTLREIQIPEDNVLDTRIAELEKEMQALQAAAEAQVARQREIQQARDLAWETYQSLLRKEAEDNIVAHLSGSEVRLASTAVPPIKPEASSRLILAAAAGFVTFCLAALAVLTLEWWQQWQEEERRTIAPPLRPRVLSKEQHYPPEQHYPSG